MAFRLQLRIQQLPIGSHFKLATIRWHERDLLDQVLVILQQFVHQAHGPTCVVSDRTVNDLDIQHVPSEIFKDYIIEAIPVKTSKSFHPQDCPDLFRVPT